MEVYTRTNESWGDHLTAFGGTDTTYDAWGNHSISYHNGGGSITVVVNNPIRYRGYYYDTDLGLYYLQTRYYDLI